MITASLAITLLIVNCIGLIQPLRPPQEYINRSSLLFKDDITIDPATALDRLQDLVGRPPAMMVEEAAMTINAAIGHAWDEDLSSELNLRVPFTENYILWLINVVSPVLTIVTGKPFDELYSRYEFNDWRKGLARGIGLCSQHAVILDGYLNEHGIASQIVNLDGHVINTVQVDDVWWLVDSDYGVIIKESLETISTRPDLVIDAYRERLTGDPMMLALIVEVYGPAGNNIAGPGSRYHGSVYVWIERVSYWLKWLIPTALLALALIFGKQQSPGPGSN